MPFGVFCEAVWGDWDWEDWVNWEDWKKPIWVNDIDLFSASVNLRYLCKKQNRWIMRKAFLLFALCLTAALSAAQEARPFDVEIRNDELKIYIRMNLYDRDVTVQGQDMLGAMDGFIGSTQSAGKWYIVDSRVKDDRTAEMEVANDYGSEDFTATVKVNDDGTYTFTKKNGSTLKFAVRGKWQKIPGKVDFVKVKQ